MNVFFRYVLTTSGSVAQFVNTCFLIKQITMLYLIGLGLGDATDITVKGLEAVRKSKHVYLEAYTSILTVGKEALVNRFPMLTRQWWGLVWLGGGRGRFKSLINLLICWI